MCRSGWRVTWRAGRRRGSFPPPRGRPGSGAAGRRSRCRRRSASPTAPVVRSRCFACSTRISRSASSGVIPSASRKCRSSLRRLTPSRATTRPIESGASIDCCMTSSALLHQRVVGGERQRHAGLRLLRRHRLVDDHDVQALRRPRPPEVPLDDEGREMRRGHPARAGQPVAVDDEDLVARPAQPVEPLEEVLVVEPADAGAVAVHQPGAVQDEGAGADADQRHAGRGGAARGSARCRGAGSRSRRRGRRRRRGSRSGPDRPAARRAGPRCRSSRRSGPSSARGRVQPQRIGRERSPSSAASRSTSTKFAKAQSVNRRARMKPTLSLRHRAASVPPAYSGF